MVTRMVSELSGGEKSQTITANNRATLAKERFTSDQTVVHP